MQSVSIKNNLENSIIQAYLSGLTQKEVANKFERSQTGISTILKRHNIPTRKEDFTAIKYKDINLDFFRKIDCEANAYFLGLMYADGNIQYDINSVYCATLLLKSDDKIILEKFRDFMCPSYHLKASSLNRTYFKMNRKEICDQLISLGCGPRKSLTLQFPTCVPSELMHHFLRGMTDGDGSIYKNKQKLVKSTGKRHINFIWKIISSIMFCDDMKIFLSKNLQINSSVYKFNTKLGTPLATITIGGNLQTYKALTWLYKDATICLPRKYEKYLELKQFINEKYPKLL